MITSKNTSVNKNKVPAIFRTVQKHYGWKKDTINLDYGGGKYDTATKFLAELGVKNMIYDPYNRPAEENWETRKLIARHNKADTVTLSNVLNVIRDNKEKKSALSEISTMFIKKGGTLYLNVYEGDKSGVGRLTKKDCWQENKKLADYLPLVKHVFGNAVMEHGLIKAIKTAIR